MSNDGVNAGRRRFLVAATSVVGAAGAVGAAVPFVGSWFPSAKAKAAGAPVQVNVGKIDPGQQIIAEWRGKPVFIVHRTKEMLDALPSLEGQLADPDSKASEQPEYVDPKLRSASAPTWAARRPSVPKSPPPTSVRTGRVATSALATAPTTTSPVVSTKASQRR